VIEEPALAHAGGVRDGIQGQVAGALLGDELLGSIEDASPGGG
jgi:hypothetical protein